MDIYPDFLLRHFIPNLMHIYNFGVKTTYRNSYVKIGLFLSYRVHWQTGTLSVCQKNSVCQVVSLPAVAVETVYRRRNPFRVGRRSSKVVTLAHLAPNGTECATPAKSRRRMINYRPKLAPRMK
ncbi:hypothetical protein AVEN_27352-1 [Araneus ventricosus]|uniref:Uncharacterized protein n=1 Tax=Araneus ventricosus TaxID=182803 RepID=A0A4Y2PBD6_ARAVE|nr:hypothetical protein AVEN_27352-1 [Araneus ventricosus]